MEPGAYLIIMFILVVLLGLGIIVFLATMDNRRGARKPHKFNDDA